MPTRLFHGLLLFHAPLGNSSAHLFQFRLKHDRVRIRHTVKGNSLKVYDKEAQVLRVETTINNPRQFKLCAGAASAEPKPLRLRLGLVDLERRAQVSRAANARYLEALASVSDKTPLYRETLSICCPLIINGKRYRALNPWNPTDGALLEALNRGEFRLNGLRNRDLRQLLYPKTTDPKEQRREAAAITRRLALLRAHGLLTKLQGTHRYELTTAGQRIITALLCARAADVDQLTQMAA